MDDLDPKGFKPGACWGITYKQGQVSVFNAVDDLPLQLLEVVTLGCSYESRKWGLKVYRVGFCIALIFNHR